MLFEHILTCLNLLKKYVFIDYLEREKKRRKRNIDRLPPTHILTGDRTGDLSVHRSHPGQGSEFDTQDY